MAHSVRCLPCDATMEAAEIVLHIHRMHPDAGAWPVCWPDGVPVAFEDPELIGEA
jgi:hypothetical protein